MSSLEILCGPIASIVTDMEAPEIHAERRAKCDSRGYDYEQWLKVAREHEAQYEPPSDIEIAALDSILYWRAVANSNGSEFFLTNIPSGVN